MATEGPVIICSAMPCQGYSAYHVKLMVPYDVVANALSSLPPKVEWLYAAPSAEGRYRSEIIFRMKHLVEVYKLKERVLKWLLVPYDARLIPWVRIARKPAQYALDWKDVKDNKEEPYMHLGKEPHKRPLRYYAEKLNRQVKVLHSIDHDPTPHAAFVLNQLLWDYPNIGGSAAMEKFLPFMQKHGYIYDRRSNSVLLQHQIGAMPTELFEDDIVLKETETENLEETKTE